MNNFYRHAKDGKGKSLSMKVVPMDAYLGSSAWQVLADEIETRQELRRIDSGDKSKKGVTGFSGLEIIAGGQPVHAWSCPGLNAYDAYLIDPMQFQFNWLGQYDNKFPIQFRRFVGGSYFRDVDGADELESRLALFPILTCKMPVRTAHLNLTNVDAGNNPNKISAYLTAS